MRGSARTTLTSDSAAEVAPKAPLSKMISFPSQESSWLGGAGCAAASFPPSSSSSPSAEPTAVATESMPLASQAPQLCSSSGSGAGSGSSAWAACNRASALSVTAASM